MINREKLLLIIQREFLVRFKSKIFIISTILGPIILIMLVVLPAILQGLSSDRSREFLVHDETGSVAQELSRTDSLFYITTDSDPEELRSKLIDGTIQGYLLIPHELLDGDGRSSFYHDGSAGMTIISRIRNDLEQAVRDVRLDRAQASVQIRDILNDRVRVDNLTITETGEDTADSGLSAFIGFIMGFIIYGAMIGYGAIIMRSVMEEKTSRIVEVIASSVRPFELLLGKVIGVALLGLTQFGIWAIAGATLLVSAAPIAAFFAGSGGESTDAAADIAGIGLPVIGWEIWVGFVLFFLLGFLIYSSLFAAVGSAVDQESDSQQLQLPIITLIIIPIMFLMPISDDPTSTLAVIMSMIPFFAPILMPVRMAVISVPFWQLGITFLLMILTFLLLMWLSSRIYRTGILMYGKKAGFREMLIWMRQE